MSVAGVTLRAMTDAEFGDWRVRSVESFAADLARATGRPLDAARTRATAQFEQSLPDGRQTTGNWLFVVIAEDGEPVGTLWLGPHPERRGMAYVYDLEIAPQVRRRGYGRAAMLAAEEVARAAGMAEIGLNVFGFNDSARQLYESIGYRTASIQMSKAL